MNGSDLYGYIKFMIQSGPHMGCRTSSLGCKEFWPSESRDSWKQICKKITDTDLLNSKNALDGNLQNPETLTQLVLDASAVIETQKRQSEILES